MGLDTYEIGIYIGRRNEYISLTVVITRTHSMGDGSMGSRLVLLHYFFYTSIVKIGGKQTDAMTG